MPSKPSSSQRGYDYKHQTRRKQLLYNHVDGTPCDYCGRPMYRDPERNFDGAPLNADHADMDKTRLASRLLHDRCNKRMNHAGAWVEHGTEWYERMGEPRPVPSGLDWANGTLITWD